MKGIAGGGDPLKCDPQSVLDGYVSVEGARRDYGVVLTPDGREVDRDATRAARAVDSSA